MFWLLDVFIVALILLATLLGAKRGLIGSVAKLMGGFLRLVVAILLAKPFSKLIMLTKLDEHLFDKLHLKFSGMSDKLNINLVGLNETQLDTVVKDALSDASIPKLFRGFFSNLFQISPETLANSESVTIAQLMSVAVVNIIMIVVSFVVLLLLLWLVVKIIVKLSKRSVKSNTVFAKTNKWLGMLFGFAKGFLIIFTLFIVVAFVSDFSFMQPVVNFINSTFISKGLYFLAEGLIDSSFDIKAMVEGWLTAGK